MFDVTHANGRHNSYCGPAAISSLTGMTAEDGASLLRKVTGKRSIKGTPSWGMIKAFRELGMGVETVRVSANTIGKWTGRGTSRYLVIVGGWTNGHYIAVEGTKFWDSGYLNGQNGASLKSISRKGLRSVWKITGRASMAVIPKPKKCSTSVRGKVMKLAKSLNVEIWDDGDLIELISPSGFCLKSMGDGSHMMSCYFMPGCKADGWNDALDALNWGIDKCACSECKEVTPTGIYLWRNPKHLTDAEKLEVAAKNAQEAIEKGCDVRLWLPATRSSPRVRVVTCVPCKEGVVCHASVMMPDGNEKLIPVSRPSSLIIK